MHKTKTLIIAILWAVTLGLATAATFLYDTGPPGSANAQVYATHVELNQCLDLTAQTIPLRDGPIEVLPEPWTQEHVDVWKEAEWVMKILLINYDEELTEMSQYAHWGWDITEITKVGKESAWLYTLNSIAAYRFIGFPYHDVTYTMGVDEVRMELFYAYDIYLKTTYQIFEAWLNTPESQPVSGQPIWGWDEIQEMRQIIEARKMKKAPQ